MPRLSPLVIRTINDPILITWTIECELNPVKSRLARPLVTIGTDRITIIFITQRRVTNGFVGSKWVSLAQVEAQYRYGKSVESGEHVLPIP